MDAECIGKRGREIFTEDCEVDYNKDRYGTKVPYQTRQTSKFASIHVNDRPTRSSKCIQWNSKALH